MLSFEQLDLKLIFQKHLLKIITLNKISYPIIVYTLYALPVIPIKSRYQIHFNWILHYWESFF